MSLVSEGVSQGSAETECKQDIAVCTTQTRVIPIDKMQGGAVIETWMDEWVDRYNGWLGGWMVGGCMDRKING